MTRRHFFLAGGSALALFAAYRILGWPSASRAAETFEVAHSDPEWRTLLTPAQFGVLRQQGTEQLALSAVRSIRM